MIGRIYHHQFRLINQSFKWGILNRLGSGFAGIARKERKQINKEQQCNSNIKMLHTNFICFSCKGCKYNTFLSKNILVFKRQRSV